MGYKSKFKGAEIDAILESCVFPSFFYNAFIQEAVTKDVIDNLWQYLRERNVLSVRDIKNSMKLAMNATNEVIVTTDLRITNDDELYIEFFMFWYDADGVVHNEYWEQYYPLAVPS